MIRINSFFEISDSTCIGEAIALGRELAEKSRAEAGCLGYEVMQSTTDPCTMMFCKTWQTDEHLTAHSSTPHFKRLVPLIKALTVNGTKCNKFKF